LLRREGGVAVKPGAALAAMRWQRGALHKKTFEVFRPEGLNFVTVRFLPRN
jgi:hypothetical protein